MRQSPFILTFILIMFFVAITSRLAGQTTKLKSIFSQEIKVGDKMRSASYIGSSDSLYFYYFHFDVLGGVKSYLVGVGKKSMKVRKRTELNIVINEDKTYFCGSTYFGNKLLTFWAQKQDKEFNYYCQPIDLLTLKPNGKPALIAEAGNVSLKHWFELRPYVGTDPIKTKRMVLHHISDDGSKLAFCGAAPGGYLLLDYPVVIFDTAMNVLGKGSITAKGEKAVFVAHDIAVKNDGAAFISVAKLPSITTNLFLLNSNFNGFELHKIQGKDHQKLDVIMKGEEKVGLPAIYSYDNSILYAGRIVENRGIHDIGYYLKKINAELFTIEKQVNHFYKEIEKPKNNHIFSFKNLLINSEGEVNLCFQEKSGGADSHEQFYDINIFFLDRELNPSIAVQIPRDCSLPYESGTCFIANKNDQLFIFFHDRPDNVDKKTEKEIKKCSGSSDIIITCAVINKNKEWTKQLIGEKINNPEYFNISEMRTDDSHNVLLGNGHLHSNNEGYVLFGKIFLE